MTTSHSVKLALRCVTGYVILIYGLYSHPGTLINNGSRPISAQELSQLCGLRNGKDILKGRTLTSVSCHVTVHSKWYPCAILIDPVLSVQKGVADLSFMSFNTRASWFGKTLSRP